MTSTTRPRPCVATPRRVSRRHDEPTQALVFLSEGSGFKVRLLIYKGYRESSLERNTRFAGLDESGAPARGRRFARASRGAKRERNEKKEEQDSTDAEKMFGKKREKGEQREKKTQKEKMRRYKEDFLFLKAAALHQALAISGVL